MTFYHRTLYHASSITHSVIGNFLDEKREDIIVSTGRSLKLLRFELGNTSPAIQTLISVDTYDIISSLSKFRRKDETKDWIIIAADSGSTTILTVIAEKMEFEVVVQEKFKVQTPKTLPVQHLAVDSQGRAIFTAAMEEVKQFWFFHGPGNRILNFLDDPEKKTLIYDIAFVDINSENIVVAYLATAYEELHVGVKYEIKRRRKPSLVFSEVDKDKVTEIKRIKCLDYANSLISGQLV
ncbi:Splicing factor 3B subunit 3 [Araneus ventricosus]|uniref:Splicing factor 3B subunit 3 n=1 Tax=Araneus ventricosus TaxID=182803 RepID=A0A4Y2QDJ4_ARAVE|nr:Splicing factor 3B subunit 3 [Araneus ventricosus]